jgi:hypothetical protein
MSIRGRGIDLHNYDVVRKSITAEVSVTATTSATGDACIAPGAMTLENGGDYCVLVYTPYLTIGTTNLDVELYDGTTFVSALSGHLTASTVHPGGFLTCILSNQSPGAHNYQITAFVDGGTGKFGAGDGATTHNPPAYMRVFPV